MRKITNHRPGAYGECIGVQLFLIITARVDIGVVKIVHSSARISFFRLVYIADSSVLVIFATTHLVPFIIVF